MAKKTIRIFTSSPCAVGNKYQTEWEDIWLVLKDRRKKRVLAPCIIGMQDLLEQIDFLQECADKNPHQPEHREEQQELIRAKNRIADGEEFVIIGEDIEMPIIYVRQEMLNKKLIEQVITHYLQVLGYLNREFRFRWDKPNLFAITL